MVPDIEICLREHRVPPVDALPGAEADTEAALRRTRRFFIDRDDLRAAVRTVVNKTLDARAVESRGPGTSCASDSRKFGSLRTL